MKTLTKSEHFQEMSDFFNAMTKNSLPIICWQTKSDGTKTIIPIFIREVNNDNKVLKAQNANAKAFEFESQSIYFFSSSEKVIFKCESISIDSDFASLGFPEEVKYIDDEAVSSLGSSLGIDEFNKKVSEGSLGSEFSDFNFINGEGRANNTDELNKTLVEGEGRANQIDEVERIKGEKNSGIDETQHMVLNTENATDKIDNNREGSTSTDHISTMQEGQTSTEHMNTRTSSKASNEKISTAWHVKSMSKSDAALFEKELSFITLDEEDKKFEGQRSTPRARPPEGKMVTVEVSDQSRPQSTHPLYDLSQGGFAFLVFAKDEFNTGEDVMIKAFDTKKFDVPMNAKVMAVREADEMGIQYKVGCQFITE